jgi:hypothetical protein
MWGSTNRRVSVQASTGIKQGPNSKKVGGVSQVVEYLPSKSKGLNSTPTILLELLSLLAIL